MIYTKKGDDGFADALSGRMSKNSQIFWVYGSLDELSAFLGMALTELEGEACADIREEVISVLRDLSALYAEAEKGCVHAKFADNTLTAKLEGWIDRHYAALERRPAFILPGGHRGASALHVARTVARRTERHLAALNECEGANRFGMHYVNRLSDYLFVAARTVNLRYDVTEQTL